MNEKCLNKHDTEVNWMKAVNFIPKIGELIVYDCDDVHKHQRIKIGDGIKNVSELPFYAGNVADLIQAEDDILVFMCSDSGVLA